jgi:hypothetical protein
MVKNYDEEIKQLLVRLTAVDGNNGFTYIGQLHESKRDKGEKVINIRDYILVETSRLSAPVRYRSEVISAWFGLERKREPNIVPLESFTAVHSIELDDWDRLEDILKQSVRDSYLKMKNRK